MHHLGQGFAVFDALSELLAWITKRHDCLDKSIGGGGRIAFMLDPEFYGYDVFVVEMSAAGRSERDKLSDNDDSVGLASPTWSRTGQAETVAVNGYESEAPGYGCLANCDLPYTALTFAGMIDLSRLHARSVEVENLSARAAQRSGRIC